MRRRRGTHISGGEQKMLAIARTLSLSQSLLILDEPFEGISPMFVKKITESINEIKTTMGISILIADSKVVGARELCDKLYVIDRGRITYEGRVEEALKTKILY